MKKRLAIILLFVSSIKPLIAQDILPEQNHTLYNVYQKPGSFSFLTNIPRDAVGAVKEVFHGNRRKQWTALAGTTLLLMFSDQAITNTVQDVAKDHGIAAAENFSPVVSVKLAGKPTNIGKMPHNFNTALYDIGQGSSTMLMAAGFFITGKIKKDNRALQTANELTEAFITLGAGTQLLKYVTGRENPSDATKRGGRWKPFPSWSAFQNNKTKYDAFPSGHLATFISAVTIIKENYPEQKWIGPVGYSLAGLCGLAMINNGVHWASDFPLGFALGYGFGKYVSHKRRAAFVP